jgi:ribosomal protein S27AE
MKLNLFGACGTARSSLASALLEAHSTLAINQDIHAPDAGACELVLLMGLDEPTRDAATEREDTRLRAHLAKSGKAFHVLYGGRQGCLQAAVALLNLQDATFLVANNADYSTASSTISAEHQEHWRWNCDKCSDPECEHRLFTGLMNAGRPGLQTG